MIMKGSGTENDFFFQTNFIPQYGDGITEIDDSIMNSLTNYFSGSFDNFQK